MTIPILLYNASSLSSQNANPQPLLLYRGYLASCLLRLFYLLSRLPIWTILVSRAVRKTIWRYLMWRLLGFRGRRLAARARAHAVRMAEPDRSCDTCAPAERPPADRHQL